MKSPAADATVATTPRVVMIRGTGSIGLRHARAVEALGHRPILVPARPERLTDLACEGFAVAATVAGAVERGAGAAIIATDTARHLRDAHEALSLGCDVLVEKPLAPEAEGIHELADACASRGRRAVVGYCLRFDRGLQAFRERLRTVGSAHAIRIACQSYLPDWRPNRDFRESYSARSDEGGVLRDLSHELDYALWLFGAPLRLTALVPRTSRLGIESEEAVELLWETAEGACVSIRLDYLTRAARRSMLVQGSEGELEWNAISGTVRTHLTGGPEEVLTFPPNRDEMMRKQIEAFLNGSPDTCTLEEARKVMLVCDAARRSASSRREEAVST